MGEAIGQIAKHLAIADLQTEVCLSIEEEDSRDLEQINALLEQIKKDWKF